MDYQLEGKLCFVTAGANGIGAAIADTLTREGARVIVADHDAATLDSRANAWHGTFAADLSTAAGIEKSVKYVLEIFGRAPDILVNNLGVADPIPFELISN
jgi:3-oxoacyl-[acyl-carrier protein] reductase